MSDNQATATVPAGFREYEDGKHRRYELLFKVNAGAFVIASIFADPPKSQLLGNLDLDRLAYGMIAFTLIMILDIFTFGWIMKTKYDLDVFTPVGMAVLVFLGALMCAGWYMVI